MCCWWRFARWCAGRDYRGQNRIDTVVYDRNEDGSWPVATSTHDAGAIVKQLIDETTMVSRWDTTVKLQHKTKMMDFADGGEYALEVQSFPAN